MKKISLLFVFFIFSFFLTNYINANNSDIIKSLIGNYEGELIYPNGDKLPITTEVYLNDSGNLEGKYTFADVTSIRLDQQKIRLLSSFGTLITILFYFRLTIVYSSETNKTLNILYLQ